MIAMTDTSELIAEMAPRFMAPQIMPMDTNGLDVLAGRGKWTAPHEIVMRIKVTLKSVLSYLKLLEKMKFVVSIPNDENGRFYQITAAGDRHQKEMKEHKRISSFPPPACRPGN